MKTMHKPKTCDFVRSMMVCAAAVASLQLAGLHAAWAQTYPSKPVRILVSFAPGGNADVTTRILAAKMSTSLGQTLLVVNKPGAAGNIGATEVAQSPADGYTLLMLPSVTAVNGLFTPNMPFDLARDFAPIGMMTTTPLVLAVPASLPVRNLKEFVEYGKNKPQGLSYGSGGMGSGSHLTSELLGIRTGLNLTHVPYKGGASAINDVMGGSVDLFFDTLVSAVGAVKTGKVRVLAVTTGSRSELLPDVPTFVQEGYPDFSEVYIWIGLMAPRGTDPKAIALLNTHLNMALNDPEVRQKLSAIGATPTPSTPEKFGNVVKAEVERWSGVIKTANIKVQ